MSESTIPWPSNNDRAFLGGEYNRTLACLDWIKCCGGDYLFADAFKKSADIIISQIEAGAIIEHPDAYFFPVTYLYRHAIELNLKQLVRHGVCLGILKDNCRLKAALKSHKLYPLWNKVKEVLLSIWPEGNRNDIKNVERIIQEFHSIDPTGQNLRYTHTNEGHSTTNGLPDSVDFINLRNTCNGLFRFFDGCDAGLSNADQGL